VGVPSRPFFCAACRPFFRPGAGGVFLLLLPQPPAACAPFSGLPVPAVPCVRMRSGCRFYRTYPLVWSPSSGGWRPFYECSQAGAGESGVKKNTAAPVFLDAAVYASVPAGCVCAPGFGRRLPALQGSLSGRMSFWGRISVSGGPCRLWPVFPCLAVSCPYTGILCGLCIIRDSLLGFMTRGLSVGK